MSQCSRIAFFLAIVSSQWLLAVSGSGSGSGSAESSTSSKRDAHLQPIVATGIVYAPEKQVLTPASPTQVFAKPSPHIAKISDALLAGQQQTYVSLLNGQAYQAPQAYHQLAKTSYAVSAPIPSHLAYSKHTIVSPQPVFQQAQQPIYHQQVQPIYHQQAQPIYHQQAQPIYQQHHQQYIHQPQIQVPVGYVQQPLPVNYVQPQLAYQPHQVAYQPHQVAYQPQIHVAQQHHQLPAYNRNEGAVSYASFSQGSQPPVQYVPKQQQQQQFAYRPEQYIPHQVLQPQVVFGGSQPQVAYATQYFGKIARGAGFNP